MRTDEGAVIDCDACAEFWICVHYSITVFEDVEDIVAIMWLARRWRSKGRRAISYSNLGIRWLGGSVALDLSRE